MLVLYETALRMPAPEARDWILDLYGGIGTSSVAVARSCKSVTAIEENPHAVQLGRVNARINAVPVEYIRGLVEKALRQVRIGRHNKAVLDPPRAGCEPAALAEILRLGPDRLGYASSQPSPHPRDLAAPAPG